MVAEGALVAEDLTTGPRTTLEYIYLVVGELACAMV